jgi:hypothetical protein
VTGCRLNHAIPTPVANYWSQTLGVYPLPVESRQQAGAWPPNRGDDSALGGWFEGWLEPGDNRFDVLDYVPKVAETGPFSAKGDADFGPVARTVFHLNINVADGSHVEGSLGGCDYESLDVNVIAPVPDAHVGDVFTALKEQAEAREVEVDSGPGACLGS